MYVLSEETINYTESITNEIEENVLNEKLIRLRTEKMFEEIWKRLLISVKGEEHIVQFPVNSYGEKEYGIPGYMMNFEYLEELLKEFGCEVKIGKVERYTSEKTTVSFLSEIMTIKTSFQNIKKILEEQKKEVFQRRENFF